MSVSAVIIAKDIETLAKCCRRIDDLTERVILPDSMRTEEGAGGAITPPPSSGTRVVNMRLPEAKGDALLALCSLENCASMVPDVKYEAGCRHKWQKEMVESLGQAVEKGDWDSAEDFDPPDNLRGENLLSWYCRCAGVVKETCSLLHLQSVDREIILIEPDEVQQFKQVEAHYTVLGDEVNGAVEKMSRAKLFIGTSSGWGYHLARYFQVPAIVVWDQGDPAEAGWKDQTNITSDEMDRLDETIKEALNG